jgi:membrane-associated protease RseP (regulator of RpoE activity)
MAGWVGILVTSLNLLPMAQFDGGHIAYAMFGRRQIWVARVFWASLLLLGRFWIGWWVWAVLAILIGRGRLGHPRLIDSERGLDARRRLLGWLGVVMFVLTLMPQPWFLAFPS